MPRKKKAGQEVTTDTFYCTVDGWRRSFTFGVNWRRGGKLEDLLGGEPYDEWDDIEVLGTVRHHSTDRKGRRRTFKKVEVRLHPTHVPRDKWRDDPEAVGGVATEKEHLRAGVTLAADAFYSLVPCFAVGHYKEFGMEVRNLR